MSRVWLEAFLGKLGDYVIYYISRYYIYIIPVIILYGIFLAISSYNFKRIEKRIDSEIVSQAREILGENPEVSYVTLVEKMEIPWEDIVDDYSFFPFIAREADLWVRRAFPDNARKIILKNSSKIKAILKRSGIYLDDKKGGIRENFYLDLVHRITRKGN